MAAHVSQQKPLRIFFAIVYLIQSACMAYESDAFEINSAPVINSRNKPDHNSPQAGSYILDIPNNAFRKHVPLIEAVSDYMGDLTMFTVLRSLSLQSKKAHKTWQGKLLFDDFSFLDPSRWIKQGKMRIDPTSDPTVFTYVRPLFPSRSMVESNCAAFILKCFPYKLQEYEFVHTPRNVRQLAVIALVDSLLLNRDRFSFGKESKINSPNMKNVLWYHAESLSLEASNEFAFLPIDNGWGFDFVHAAVTGIEGKYEDDKGLGLDEEMGVRLGVSSDVQQFAMLIREEATNPRAFASRFMKLNKLLFHEMQWKKPYVAVDTFVKTWEMYAEKVTELVKNIAEKQLPLLLDSIAKKCDANCIERNGKNKGACMKKCVDLFDKKVNPVNYQHRKHITEIQQQVLKNVNAFKKWFARRKRPAQARVIDEVKYYKHRQEKTDVHEERWRLQRLMRVLQKVPARIIAV